MEVTERMTENHSQVIDTIAKAMMKDMNMGKAEAAAMRNVYWASADRPLLRTGTGQQTHHI